MRQNGGHHRGIMIRTSTLAMWAVIFSCLTIVLIAMQTVPKETINLFGYALSIDAIVGIVGTIAAMFVGWLAYRLIGRRLDRLPKNLFKTRFTESMTADRNNWDKPLILYVGQTWRGTFDAKAKMLCGSDRIGVRPQEKRHWYQHWFIGPRTSNIRENPPVKVLFVRDANPRLKDGDTLTKDDTVYGQWVYYTAKPKEMNPGELVLLEVEIKALRVWDGYIDFRCDPPDGMRTTHHPCRVVPK